MTGLAVRAAAAVEDGPPAPQPGDYVYKDGLCLVRPYHFNFRCSVKARWEGSTLAEAFAREFPGRPPAYYTWAIAHGKLHIEGELLSDPQARIRAGQRLRHLVHRHEPPVLACDPAVLGQTPDIVAVFKPAGLPVHETGPYRKNTLLARLRMLCPDLGPLYPVHRLDKPVGGVLLLARSPEAAEKMRVALESRRDVRKRYVARVQGEFLGGRRETLRVEVPLAWDRRGHHVYAAPGALAESEQSNFRANDGPAAGSEGASTSTDAPAEEPLSLRGERRARAMAKKALKARRAASKEPCSDGIARSPTLAHVPACAEAPRAAVSEFRLLSVAPDRRTSLVECVPLTGRTHQLRVHLQHLGHPIANDGQYGGRFEGPRNARLLAREMGIAWDAMRRQHGLEVWEHEAEAGQGSEEAEAGQGSDKAGKGTVPAQKKARVDSLGAKASDSAPPRDEAHALHDKLISDERFRIEEAEADPICPHCPLLSPRDYPLDLRPLWLFAVSYACGDWEFEAPLPGWAEESWVPEDPASST
ncbi:hypothetical protein H632_c1818p1 [Helicosporidium sp. ATCC 50920]|nr:hypothetical protein H632_c1818p1 [Helicosporidium sp. ATCC 50920]|eukprot:KDD73813.1 hypothetical protein H632_c1818p1 [Helicosporidium sp. ATCC 50920]